MVSLQTTSVTCKNININSHAHLMNLIFKSPKQPKTRYRQSLFPRTIPVWDNLPPAVKMAPDMVGPEGTLNIDVDFSLNRKYSCQYSRQYVQLGHKS